MLEFGAKLLNNRHITIETEKKSQKNSTKQPVFT